MPRKKSGEFDNKLYQNEYHKAMKTKLISFNPNSPEDMRLWDYLQTKDNQTGYIKKLIRENMNKEGYNMKYKIKAEYLDLWEGGDSPSDPDRIITEEELNRLSDDWGVPVEELLEQLIPVE